MVKLVEGFGFKLSRTDGSHHVFSRADIPELVNIQSVKGQVKPYQIRQFLKLVEKYDVNGPWCITFEWEAGDAFKVDLEQYH